MSQKILITGSTGFIGTHIVKTLLKKKTYIYVILRKKNKNNKRIKALQKNHNYFPIFYEKFTELEKKLKKLKVNVIINYATFYTHKYDIKSIINLINTNIIFCSIILEIFKTRLKKFINFGSMMEYSKGSYFYPMNFYAITKYFFQEIEKFYKRSNKNIKFYDLKLYETYGDEDKRNKIIPTIIKNYSLNKNIKIISRNLKMNFVHVESLANVVNNIVFKNIKEGEYCLKNRKFVNIKKLLQSLNKKLKKKIKVKYISYKTFNNRNIQFKKFPFWSDNHNLKSFLFKKMHK